MATPPTNWVTVDDLGVGPSITWAQLDKNAKELKLSAASLVTPFAETLIATPIERNAFNKLFDFDIKNWPFSLFCPPEAFPVLPLSLYTYLIVPSLGTKEEQEASAKRILDYEEKNKEQEEEKQSIIALFVRLGILDKNLLLVNQRRGQYQKG